MIKKKKTSMDGFKMVKSGIKKEIKERIVETTQYQQRENKLKKQEQKLWDIQNCSRRYACHWHPRHRG